MTPEAMACVAAENAMFRHHMNRTELAARMGCSVGSVSRILDSQEVRLTTAQFISLFQLGGQITTKKEEPK